MYPRARTAVLAASLLAPLTAHAIAVSVADLPATVQSCVTSNTCSVGYTSIYDSGTASAFGIYNAGQTGFNYLVRYALVPPSGAASSSTDFYQDPPATTSSATPYTGYLWMQVQGGYSTLESAHPITLYLDKVSPVPASFYNQSGDLSLFVASSDLLSGSSYVKSGLDSNNQDYVSGNLSGEVPFGCLAGGCAAFAQLNLTQLRFTQTGTSIVAGFNAADPRGLVFTSGLSDDGSVSGYASSSSQSFYISAVPDPEPIRLFSTGLACLIIAMRRRRTPSCRWATVC